MQKHVFFLRLNLVVSDVTRNLSHLCLLLSSGLMRPLMTTRETHTNSDPSLNMGDWFLVAMIRCGYKKHLKWTLPNKHIWLTQMLTHCPEIEGFCLLLHGCLLCLRCEMVQPMVRTEVSSDKHISFAAWLQLYKACVDHCNDCCFTSHHTLRRNIVKDSQMNRKWTFHS